MIMEGIYAPIPTPFEHIETENICWSGYRDNLEKWKKSPLSGLVVAGSNGELPFLDADERAALCAAAREMMGEGEDRKKIIVGAHQPSVKHTLSGLAQLKDAGADAVLLLPPHYFKGQGAASIIDYFERIADRSPLPIVLYNMPGNTAVTLEADTMLRLAEHENIIGVKDSSGDMTRLGYLCERAGPDFSVFCGSGNYLLPALTIGASGGTLAVSNLYAAACAALVQLYEASDIAAARSLQLRIMKVSDAVTRRWGVPGLKAAMKMKGFYGGPCRSPLLPLSAAAEFELSSILETASLDGYENWWN